MQTFDPKRIKAALKASRERGVDEKHIADAERALLRLELGANLGAAVQTTDVDNIDQIVQEIHKRDMTMFILIPS